MELHGWKSKLHRFMEWTMMLAYLNFLWMGGIVIGAGVLGIFPSTAAMLSAIRKWIQDEDFSFSLFSYFKQEYKKEFLRANLYGYIWSIIGVILFVDLHYFRGHSGLGSLLLSFFFFILSAIYIAAVLYAFPVYVHFKLTLFQYVKNTVYIVLSNPIFSVVMALGFYFPYWIISRFPGLLPFFGGSFIGFVLMRLSYFLFEKLEKMATTDQKIN
ncbi:YesL family protein [Neobacillus sp. Marseille-QA0830]